MKHAAPHSCRFDHLNGAGACGAVVNHYRQVHTLRQIEHAFEEQLLLSYVGLAAIDIESDFTHRYDRRIADRSFNPIEIGFEDPVGFARMNSYRAVDLSRKTIHNVEAPFASFAIDSDGDGARHACGACACQHIIKIVGKVFVVEMAVCVYHVKQCLGR